MYYIVHITYTIVGQHITNLRAREKRTASNEHKRLITLLHVTTHKGLLYTASTTIEGSDLAQV